jgi:hypothetical protein
MLNGDTFDSGVCSGVLVGQLLPSRSLGRDQRHDGGKGSLDRAGLLSIARKKKAIDSAMRLVHSESSKQP